MVAFNVVGQGVSVCSEVLGSVENQVRNLEVICDQVSRCEVSISKLLEAPYDFEVYQVRIVLHVAGRYLVAVPKVKRDPRHVEMENAVVDAFQAAAQVLKSYVDRERNQLRCKTSV